MKRLEAREARNVRTYGSSAVLVFFGGQMVTLGKLRSWIDRVEMTEETGFSDHPWKELQIKTIAREKLATTKRAQQIFAH